MNVQHQVHATKARTQEEVGKWLSTTTLSQTRTRAPEEEVVSTTTLSADSEEEVEKWLSTTARMIFFSWCHGMRLLTT